MNKKYMKTGLLGFMAACIAAYSAYVAHDSDPRAEEFADYISTQIDKMVAEQLTDEELQAYIKSYRENPKMFDLWIEQLAEDSKNIDRALMKDAAVIHKLDSVAGCRMVFGDAMRRIEALQDTAANPSSEIKLQRLINSKKETDACLALSRAAKERINAEK